MSARLQDYRRLRQAGVGLGSLALFPLRRRLRDGFNRLDLPGEATLVASLETPLAELVDEIWLRQSYRPAGCETLRGATVIDVGANVGVFTVWASRRMSAARVVALEPAGAAAAQLRENVRRNGLDGVAVLEVAVGGRRREATLYGHGASLANTLFGTDASGNALRPISAVQVITLRDLFETLEIEHCDLLKLDCEGAEYEILLNADRETLERIDRIVAEYHRGLDPREPESLRRFLEDRNFSVDRLTDVSPESGYLHASRNE